MADYTTETKQIQTLLTTTTAAYLDSGTLHDQVFNQHPLTRDLFARAKMVSGGYQIEGAMMYGKQAA